MDGATAGGEVRSCKAERFWPGYYCCFMLARTVALVVAIALFWSGFIAAGDQGAFAATPSVQTQDLPSIRNVEAAASGTVASRAAASPAATTGDFVADQFAERGSSHSEQEPDVLPVDQLPAGSSETASEFPEVIVALPGARLWPALATAPAAHVAATRLSPYLDGPQRPPCRAT